MLKVKPVRKDIIIHIDEDNVYTIEEKVHCELVDTSFLAKIKKWDRWDWCFYTTMFIIGFVGSYILTSIFIHK